MEEANGLAVGGETQPQKGHFEDAVSVSGSLGRGGDSGPDNVGGAPLEEDKMRVAGADTTPEPNKVFPAVEGLVKAREGGAAASSGGGGPGPEAGAEAPAALAHEDPEGALVGCGAAEGGKAAGGAGKGGDLGGREEGEDVELDVLREVGERHCRCRRGRGHGLRAWC